MMRPASEINNLRTRQRLLEAAIPHLASQGLQPKLLEAVIAETGCPPERAQLFFQHDEDFVMALYLRLASDLERVAANLADGTVAERFHAIVTAKLAMAAPYKEALAALLGVSLNPRHELGVLSQHAAIVRERVLSVFEAVVAGASDKPPGTTPAFVRALYTAHLGIILVWLRDKTPRNAATVAALNSMQQLIAHGGSTFTWVEHLPSLMRLDGVLGSISSAKTVQDELPVRILRCLFRHRRLLPTAGNCAEHPCAACFALHLAKVRRSILRCEPIHLLLPAFPAKSPSPDKVLGTLPDKADELALLHLQSICDEIGALYSPGARLTICSDGHVFSDLVGVSDEGVSAYAERIRVLLDQLPTPSIDTFSMEDLYETTDFVAMRSQLTEHYGESRAVMEQRVHTQPQHLSLVNGIERFLVEEQPGTAEGSSKSQRRKICRQLAYEVVRRSDAWGQLISDCFPLALRLSIHPQLPHSEKIGILLGAAEDIWMTPWHGVAVETGTGFILMKRREAEERGATLVFNNGRPDYFTLNAYDSRN